AAAPAAGASAAAPAAGASAAAPAAGASAAAPAAGASAASASSIPTAPSAARGTALANAAPASILWLHQPRSLTDATSASLYDVTNRLPSPAIAAWTALELSTTFGRGGPMR